MAALKWEAVDEIDDLVGPGAGKTRFGSLPSGTETRVPSFRLMREPRPWRRRRTGPANPLRWAVVCAALPAFLLVAYVALWTAAMRTGYQKQRLSERIEQLKVENNSLQAQMRRLQSPRRIQHLAAQIGMQPAEQVGYIFVVGASRPR